MSSELLTLIRSNPKFFYSYAKKFSKLTSKIGPLLNKNNEYTCSSAEMSEILRSQSGKPYPMNKFNTYLTELMTRMKISKKSELIIMIILRPLKLQ